jgi:dethiobiotin synthetase
MGRIVFITGTDTGVGKTVATGLLLYHLRQSGVRALAMKPFCTGDREDVEVLQSLQAGELSQEEMNPWFFKMAVAPLVAARAEGRRVSLAEVLPKITSVSSKCDLLLVEGAGGLLSPLGEGVTFADIIGALGGEVVVVAPNKLGVVNLVCLTLEMLEKTGDFRSKVLLMGQADPDISVASNAALLGEWAGESKKSNKKVGTSIFEAPFLGCNPLNSSNLKKVYKKVKKVLQALAIPLS